MSTLQFVEAIKSLLSSRMEIDEIKTELDDPDFQRRFKAIAALKDYDPEVAGPLIIGKLRDPHFLVRSFVARGLGTQQTAASFTALLEMLTSDPDANVKAEAANSLSLFGQDSISYLVLAFHQDESWLLRHSILAVLVDMNCWAELLDVCTQAIIDADLTVQEVAIEILSILPDVGQVPTVLQHLLPLVGSEYPNIRMRVARALRRFDDPQAKESLIQLALDKDPQVVGAALEDLL